MEGIVNSVKLLMEERGLNQTALAKGSGTSTRLVSDFFSQKTSPKLLGVMGIIKFMFPSEYEDVMIKYCKEVTKKSAVISSLEYSARINNVELLEFLLNKFNEDKSLEEAVQVYNLELLSKNNNFHAVIAGGRELLGKTSSKELKLKIQLLEANAYYKLNEQDVMNRVFIGLEQQLDELRNGYIKEAYKFCFYSVSARAHLYARGDSEKAIEFAHKAISVEKIISQEQIAQMYHIIGQAYINESLESSLEYLNKSMNLYSINGFHDWALLIKNNDIPFAMNVNEVNFEYFTGLDRGEWAHQLLVRGDREKARNVLGECILKDDFERMYYNEAIGNALGLMKAHSSIVKTGNVLFSSLAEQKITKLIKGIEI